MRDGDRSFELDSAAGRMVRAGQWKLVRSARSILIEQVMGDFSEGRTARIDYRGGQPIRMCLVAEVSFALGPITLNSAGSGRGRRLTRQRMPHTCLHSSAPCPGRNPSRWSVMPNSHGPDLKPQMSGSRTSPALPTRGRRQGVPFPLDICGPRVEFVPLSAARRLGRVWIINAIEQLGPVVYVTGPSDPGCKPRVKGAPCFAR
jgi:hypothetical protein